jgi:hypothetical protein
MYPMALSTFVKELSVFGPTIKNFSQLKKSMVNYLDILKIWEVVEKSYVPKYKQCKWNVKYPDYKI